MAELSCPDGEEALNCILQDPAKEVQDECLVPVQKKGSSILASDLQDQENDPLPLPLQPLGTNFEHMQSDEKDPSPSHSGQGPSLHSSVEHCPPSEGQAYSTGTFTALSDWEEQALQDERFARKLQEDFDAEFAKFHGYSDSVAQLEADRKLAEQLEMDGRLALQLSAESSAGVSNLSGLVSATLPEAWEAAEGPAESATKREEINLPGSSGETDVGSCVNLPAQKRPAVTVAESNTGTHATRQDMSPPMPRPLPSITKGIQLEDPSSTPTTKSAPPDVEAAQGTGAASDGGKASEKFDSPSQRTVPPLIGMDAGGDASQSGDDALLAEVLRQSELDNGDYELCVICLAMPSTAGFVHGSSVHKICCKNCAEAVMATSKPECPICCQPVDLLITDFF